MSDDSTQSGLILFQPPDGLLWQRLHELVGKNVPPSLGDKRSGPRVYFDLWRGLCWAAEAEVENDPATFEAFVPKHCIEVLRENQLVNENDQLLWPPSEFLRLMRVLRQDQLQLKKQVSDKTFVNEPAPTLKILDAIDPKVIKTLLAYYDHIVRDEEQPFPAPASEEDRAVLRFYDLLDDNDQFQEQDGRLLSVVLSYAELNELDIPKDLKGSDPLLGQFDIFQGLLFGGLDRISDRLHQELVRRFGKAAADIQMRAAQCIAQLAVNDPSGLRYFWILYHHDRKQVKNQQHAIRQILIEYGLFDDENLELHPAAYAALEVKFGLPDPAPPPLQLPPPEVKSLYFGSSVSMHFGHYSQRSGPDYANDNEPEL